MKRSGIVAAALSVVITIVSAGSSAAAGVIDANRDSLITLLNNEQFLAPVLDDRIEDRILAQGEFSDPLLPPDERGRRWRAAKKGLAVALGTVGGGLLGFAIGGPVGAGIGAAAGAAGYGTAAVDLNQPQLRGSSFVVDMPFYDELVIDGENVTSLVLSAATSNVIRTDTLGWSTGNSLSFVDPALVDAFIVDGSGNEVSSSLYLGIDMILMNRTDVRGGTQSAIGFAVYNDPSATGRALQMTDRISINLSALGIHFGETIGYNGTLLIASPQVPNPPAAVMGLMVLMLVSRRRR